MIVAIPAADVVEKTEWDKLMFLVEAANNVMESAPKWISVKERLPEYGQYVLAYSADDDYMTVEARRKFDAFQITHWMPLPQPPKEVQDGN